MLKKSIFQAALTASLLFLGAVPLKAQFAVCNQSFDVINVAIGHEVRGQIRTRGWWKIGPNQCASTIRDPLTTPVIYVFAQDVFGKELLNGAFPLCVRPRRFSEDIQTDCLVRGFLEADFIEVDTQGTERWTLFVSAQPE